MNRRQFLAAAGISTIASGNLTAGQTDDPMPSIKRHGRIKQGLWLINFGDSGYSFEDTCRHARRLGAYGMDLIPPADWPLLRQYHLEPLLAKEGPMDFTNGIIHPAANEKMEAPLLDYIDFCADNGIRQFVGIGGQHGNMAIATAADHAVGFLNRIKHQLERKNVTLAIENMNNRRTTAGYGRPGQVFGHWDWGLDVVRRVNSSHVKLLCDIYHLQIMDGDLATRIKESIEWIAHFHVAGVPSRNEINHDQEINYRYLAELIAGLDYRGYVSHEWRPAAGRDPLEAIEQAMTLMDV